jgi:hypothetical protein
MLPFAVAMWRLMEVEFGSGHGESMVIMQPTSAGVGHNDCPYGNNILPACLGGSSLRCSV